MSGRVWTLRRGWRDAGSIRRAAFACAAAGALAGCGDADTALPKATTYEVKGQVLLRDGKPLTAGRVTFVPTEAPALQATGEVGPDGSFSLSTLRPDDGAVPGPYRVRVEPPASQTSEPAWLRRLPYPGRYTDEDSSGLVLTIRPEANRLDPIRLR